MIDPKKIPGAEFDSKTGRWTITLAHPFKDDGTPIIHNGVALTSIVMRRAKVNDLLNVQRVPGLPQADMELQLFSVLSGVPATTIGELDQVDYGAMQEVYSDFLALRQRTYEKPASISQASQAQGSLQS